MLYTFSDLLSLTIEDEMIKKARDLSSWNDHHGDMADCYHNSMIRCYAFTLSGGFCLRANSLVTYCEANRQVCISNFPKSLIISIFCCIRSIVCQVVQEILVGFVSGSPLGLFFQ